MNSAQAPEDRTNPIVGFLGLLRRAAASLPMTKHARCARCGRVTKFHVVAETRTTQESIYACEVCGLQNAL